MIAGFLKDVAKYLPAHIVPAITGFISIPIITRIFVPEDYGNYSLAMATVMVLSTLLGWLPVSIIRFYPVYERDNKSDLFNGNVLRLSLISISVVALVSLALLFFVRAYLSPKLSLLLFIGIGVFVVLAVFNVFQHFLRSMRRVGWYSFFASWRTVAGLGLGLGLIFLFKLGIEGLLWGIILCIVIILPLLWKKAGGNASIIGTRIDVPLLKTMARYSLPLAIGNLAAWILSLSDRYILEVFRGAQEVGIYSASYDIADRSIRVIVSLFLMASGPISIHIWEKEAEARSKEFMSNVTRYYLIACVPAAIGLSALSRPIIRVMTGTVYYEGYRIVPFVVLGILLLGLQERFQSGFLFHKKTVLIAYGMLLSGVLNLLLNLLFVPRYGYYAAAITTLVSYGFLLFLMIVLSRRFFVWPFPLESLANVTLASAVMAVLVYPLGNWLTSSDLLNVFLGVCVGLLAYVITLFLLGEFKAVEVQGLWATIGHRRPGHCSEQAVRADNEEA